MNNNILEITYKEGRGHLKLDLSAALPCTAGDMKRIISFLDLSADPARNAEKVYSFCAGRVEDLKAARKEVNNFSDSGKREIAALNAEIKRYIRNAAALAKEYGFQEITDAEAQIKMHAGTVYAVVFKSTAAGGNNAACIETFDGWTFEKSGYTFSVYRETNNDGTKGNYLILVSDTGLKIAEAKTKAGCPSEITPDIIDILNRPGNQKKLNAYRDRFKNHMIDAGYMDPKKIQEPAPVQAAKKEDAAPVQEPEKIQEPAPDSKEEKRARNILKIVKGGKRMYDVSYSMNTVSIRGKGDIKTFPCEYNITDSGAVLLFIIVGTKEDGRKEKQRVKIEKSDVYYGAALAAAKAAGATDPTEKKKHAAPVQAAKKEDAAPVQEPEKIQEPATVQELEKIQEPAPVQEPEKVQEPAPVQAAKKEDTGRDPKAARGPVPEKTFIGETIQGNGWKIYFDGDAARTRVMFDEKPNDTARAAVENAGFYYSPKMDSWKKKLTFKAYRAAKKLSGDLEKIFAA